MHKVLEEELRKEFNEIENSEHLVHLTREQMAEMKDEVIRKYARIHRELVMK